MSSALLLFVALVAPDVICPDRRQRVLPLMFARPLTGVDYVVAKVGAIATILFAFSFLPQVLLFVGNMLVSDSALTYFKGHLDVLWKVPVSVVLLAVYYAVIGVAIASLTDRRIVAGAAVIGLFLVTSIASGILVGEERTDGSSAALLNVLALPLYLRDIVFLGHVDPTSPLGGVAYGGRDGRRHLRRRRSPPAPPCCSGATAGWSDDDVRSADPSRRHRRLRSAPDPAFAVDPTVEIDNVSVWFGPKVALSDLSCSFGPGVTGLLGPNGAGKTTLMRALTGMVGVNQGRVLIEGHDPRRDRSVHARMALVPEDEAVPAGLTARQFVRYTADLHRIADRGAPDAALATVGMLDVADRRVDGFSKGMRQRTKIASALVCDPQVLVLDEPLNGADPVQRISLITLFRRLGAEGRTVIVSSHVLNEVERLAERGHRPRPRPAGRRRRPPGHPRRHGRPAPPRARAGRRPPPAGRRARRPRLGGRRHVRPDPGRARHPDRAGRRAGPRPPPPGPRRLGPPARGAGPRRLAGEPVPGARPMSAPVDSVDDGRPRPRLLVIVRYTLQSCIPPRRWAAVLAACAGAILFGLLTHAIDATADRAFANVAAEGILSLAVPIAALVIGDAVLGAEIRGGTFSFTWMSPTPIWQIVLGRWLGGSLVAIVTIAPACAIAAVVAGAPSSIGRSPWPPPSAPCPTSPCSSPSGA